MITFSIHAILHSQFNEKRGLWIIYQDQNQNYRRFNHQIWTYYHAIGTLSGVSGL